MPIITAPTTTTVVVTTPLNEQQHDEPRAHATIAIPDATAINDETKQLNGIDGIIPKFSF